MSKTSHGDSAFGFSSTVCSGLRDRVDDGRQRRPRLSFVHQLCPLVYLSASSSQPCRDFLTTAHFQADTLMWRVQGQGSSKLVIHCDVPEEVSHGLAIVDSPNCLRKNQADVHSLYLGTLQFLELVRDSVRHHHLVTKPQRAHSHCVCQGVATKQSISNIEFNAPSSSSRT